MSIILDDRPPGHSQSESLCEPSVSRFGVGTSHLEKDEVAAHREILRSVLDSASACLQLDSQSTVELRQAREPVYYICRRP